MATFTVLQALVLFTVSATQVLAQSCLCGYKDSNGHVWVCETHKAVVYD